MELLTEVDAEEVVGPAVRLYAARHANDGVGRGREEYFVENRAEVGGAISWRTARRRVPASFLM